MGKFGRPKLPSSKRREAGALHIRLNQEELSIVEEKAREAGVTPHEWARLAALERDPPPRQIVPELNKAAWRETAKTLAILKSALWRLQPGTEDSLRAMLEGVKDELVSVRKQLAGGES